jgi:anti-anti-sigma factor
MEEPLSIAVAEGRPTIVTLVGDLDLATVSTLRAALSRLDGADLIVDCAELQFLDSTGISLFVELGNEREHVGRTMVLRNVTGIPRRTLEICGLLETFTAADGD